MKYTFTFGTRDDAMRMVKRLERLGMSSDLNPSISGQFKVSGRTTAPAVEVEVISFGLRVLSFSTQED